MKIVSFYHHHDHWRMFSSMIICVSQSVNNIEVFEVIIS